MTNDTQRQINRMVDGELTVEEQHALLTPCEANDQWRELALAYVEAQVFKSELSVPLARESSSFVSHRQTCITDEGASPRLHSPAEAAVVRTNGQEETEESKRRLTRDSWNAMSLAAAVLVSLGLGYGLGWWWQGGGVEQYVQSPTDPREPNTQKVETMPFLVSDATGNEMKQVTLPLVNVSDLGPNWQQKLQQPDVPEELINELRSGGINVRQQRTMTRVRLPDGRLVVVPIDYFYEELFQ